MNFVGEHVHSLDAKWRLILPRKLREGLGSQVTLQKGIDPCVLVYPPAAWDEVVAKVNAIPTTDPNARKFNRFFFSQASHEQIDGQGRLTVPQSFRDYAGLEREREVVVAGVGTRVEIWDKARYEQHRSADEGDIGSIAAQLGI